MIVDYLKPPYYAVIFSTLMTDNIEGYQEAAERMEALANLHVMKSELPFRIGKV